jgi:hypothetical protein
MDMIALAQPIGCAWDAEFHNTDEAAAVAVPNRVITGVLRFLETMLLF